MLTRDALLKDIALDHPRAIFVLEELHLDYCCQGSRPLAVACLQQGLDPEQVLLQLREHDGLDAAPAPDVSTLTTAQALIDHIVCWHHTFTRDSMATLRPLLAKVLRVHGDEHSELADVAEAATALFLELEPHMLKEEQILFPALCAIERNEDSLLPFPVSHPIDRMRAEHDAVGDLLRALSTLTRSYAPPAEACTSWRALYRGLADLERDLHLHIHLENNVLFARLSH